MPGRWLTSISHTLKCSSRAKSKPNRRHGCRCFFSFTMKIEDAMRFQNELTDSVSLSLYHSISWKKRLMFLELFSYSIIETTVKQTPQSTSSIVNRAQHRWRDSLRASGMKRGKMGDEKQGPQQTRKYPSQPWWVGIPPPNFTNWG